MGIISRLFGKGRRSAKDSNLPRTAEGAAARVRLSRSGEADRMVPATETFKKGGAVKKKTTSKVADMEGRAMKKKTADTKGRAMKKTGMTGYGGVVAMGMKKGGKAAKKGK
jgi:hypothetical protein